MSENEKTEASCGCGGCITVVIFIFMVAAI